MIDAETSMAGTVSVPRGVLQRSRVVIDAETEGDAGAVGAMKRLGVLQRSRVVIDAETVPVGPTVDPVTGFNGAAS